MFNFLSPKVPQIDIDVVKKAIDAKEDFVLLDVRTPQEFAKGSITGSINVPLDTVQNQIQEVLPIKTKIVYVYCLSGSRSVYAVETMIKLGYIHVFNMTQGLLAWRSKKYSL